MAAVLPFERRSFAEIVAMIRLIFPCEDAPEFFLTPGSIRHILTLGGVKAERQRIPNWKSYECGACGISDEEFVAMLFAPLRPAPDETVVAITDDCFSEGRQLGFAVRFGDLLPFARDVYPTLFSPPVAFFQPLDMIIVAEKSTLLVMLHHEGWWTQYAG